MSNPKQIITDGKAVLGIEFGSTRIKAVLVDESNSPIASGSHEWENMLINKIWTYSLDYIWQGLQDCYADLLNDVHSKYSVDITHLAAIGISAMQHGYMPFDDKGNLLVPFRTWRNTTTEEAAEKLVKLFNYNIPLRWSIAHLYQAILNDESHVPSISYLTTLAGYMHWQLTGEKVIGVGDASGMFPIDINTHDYNSSMIQQFDELVAPYGFGWHLSDILPKVRVAGKNAGLLTEQGAKKLDVSGALRAGIPLCPPEGDGETGMAATNSVAVRTGNISAGTSIFAMAVMDKELSIVHPEIDIIMTPSGDPVAMAHCNNCTSDLNEWINMFREFSDLFDMKIDMKDLFGKLYNIALEGDKDCGGLLSYNYVSGETMTGFDEGRPLFTRMPDAKLTLANFMRTHLFTTLAGLKIGMDIILKEEKIPLDVLVGHGGFFKTEGVGQKIIASALNTPVSVMSTAGEGGAWGIALLASYLVHKQGEETFPDFLTNKVFNNQSGKIMPPDKQLSDSFEIFLRRYVLCLPIERAAVDTLGI